MVLILLDRAVEMAVLLRTEVLCPFRILVLSVNRSLVILRLKNIQTGLMDHE